ncbi:hypothetical protein HQN64_14950 [Enterobacteriaceae bacterium BIT-l23]|uniref:TcdA/TcdB catalytic glycosyltransferase domain-containing protein n=1 Tax=Jejubacter sp. L23 TaxID=3092086 RepID=UPI0015853964|nr:hypothetical protein [Enterobacteriaceae bacterium BIT-l23]
MKDPHDDFKRRLRAEIVAAFNQRAPQTLPQEINRPRPDVSHIAHKPEYRIPDLIHTVWIGDRHSLDLSYIQIWKAANPNKTCCLWVDSGSHDCQRFHHQLANHVKTTRPCDRHDALLRLQNEAFAFIHPQMAGEKTFNALAAQFLALKGIPEQPRPVSPTPASDLQINEIASLFTGKFAALRRCYDYEVILRGNFAAASDIVRLLILYRFGGLYIDRDTLPDIDGLFTTTNAWQHLVGIPGHHAITRAKSTALLIRLRAPNEDALAQIRACLLSFPEPLREPLCQAIIADTAPVRLADIRALEPIACYRDLPVLSALSWLPETWFSNVIGCAPGAKGVSIMLRTIHKRYRFLESNNAIFTLIASHDNRHYLSRLLPWRYESLIKTGEVTLALTGPGMIVEVLLALGYQILKLSEEIPPAFLSEAMHGAYPGIAFFSHTLDTPLSARSTWMNGLCNNRESAR